MREPWQGWPPPSRISRSLEGFQGFDPNGPDQEEPASSPAQVKLNKAGEGAHQLRQVQWFQVPRDLERAQVGAHGGEQRQAEKRATKHCAESCG